MFATLAALVVVVIVGLLFMNASRPVRLPHAAGDWGAKANDDPRIAAAGMLCCVASEDGPLDEAKTTQITLLLTATRGLEPESARACFNGGQRLARRLQGNLNSRLHQLRGPVERH